MCNGPTALGRSSSTQLLCYYGFFRLPENHGMCLFIRTVRSLIMSKEEKTTKHQPQYFFRLSYVSVSLHAKLESRLVLRQSADLWIFKLTSRSSCKPEAVSKYRFQAHRFIYLFIRKPPSTSAAFRAECILD